MLQTIFVDPVYNLLVFILAVVPGADFGIAIIALTLIVRVVFYPVFTSSIRTQMAMQVVQPELAELQEKYKDDRMELARRQAELFTRHRIRPFATLGASLIQLVFFITLYYVFFRLGLPQIKTELLYPFVHAPASVNEHFLGLFDLTSVKTLQNALLAVLVGALQYVVMHFALSRTGIPEHLPPEKQAAQRIQRQMMLYLFPLMMLAVVYFSPAAVGLYFAVSNIIALGQEWLIRRKPL